MRAALLGAAVAGLLGIAVVAASWGGSPLRAGGAERTDMPSAIFLAACGCAFVLYLFGLLVLRRHGGGVVAVCAVAAAIQLVPLAGPLLFSRDVYSYWAYGRLTAAHDANPYAVPPGRFPADPAVRDVAPSWQGTTSVYGPAFTAASAGLETTTGRSAEVSSFVYRLVAALGMLALVALAALLAPGAAFGAAFVGWNPLLAIDFAGGGHNDVWMMVFVLGALAVAARRPVLAGAGWAIAGGVKFVALGLLPLRLLAAGRGEAGRTTLGFATAAFVGACVASLFFGTAWLSALGPLAHRHAAWSLGSRLGLLGLPRWIALVPLALALPWLVRSARNGHARLGAASALGLLATPWLLPWYAVWAVPLAAIEEDTLAWALALGLSAYLLTDRVPI